MSPTLVAIVKSLILPPGILIILFLFCFYLFSKKRGVFVFFMTSTILLLYIFSIPAFSRYLASVIETDEPINVEAIKNSDMKIIIILGCDRHANAPEFQGDTVSACTLIRLRYAAILHKATKIPILVSGGNIYGENKTEAELMRDVLVKELGVDVQWIENKSRNTIENAERSAEILKANDINHAILITHAIHMLRAEYAFSKYGIQIMPAPTYYYSSRDHKPTYFDFLPSIKAFYASNTALYEIIGYYWMQIRLGT